MNHRVTIGIAVICVATLAAAQPKGNSVRVGAPLSMSPTTVTVAADAGQPPGRQSTPDTVVLDVDKPKLQYDAGETVLLSTHLHTQGGADLDGDVAVDDDATTGPMDSSPKHKPRRHGVAKAKGRQHVTLDNSPGEHRLIVWADTVDSHGNSVHRAAADYYVVSTGEMQLLDVGRVHPVGDLLVVELKVKVKGQGVAVFDVQATLASGAIAVAQAGTEVTLGPGPATIELPFAQRDIVEPGPYRLVNVTVTGGSGEAPGLVAAPRDVGKPFQAKHADHEPDQPRNADGELVGTGRDVADLHAPPPPDQEPPAAVIPPLPPEYGYPVDLNNGPPQPPGVQ
jgi:hypothetical protein